MRKVAICVGTLLTLGLLTFAADVEQRQLTTYVAQDKLESIVRNEGWTEFPLNVKGGTFVNDTIRVWSGGFIERGNGDHPNQNVDGPEGVSSVSPETAKQLALSPNAEHAYAMLWKTENGTIHRCLPQGKPLEFKLTKEKEKVWVGFNDEKGHFSDNHIGRGRRQELDPLWMRVEVVRIVIE